MRWAAALLGMACLGSASAASPKACTYIPSDLYGWTRYYAAGFGLDHRLLAALIWVESNYCQHQVSKAGAIGLGQLMPQTARAMGIDPRDPVSNIYGSARYLRQMYDTFGDWPMAIAAYNAGPGRVRTAGGIPAIPETVNHVQKVLAYYQAFQTLP